MEDSVKKRKRLKYIPVTYNKKNYKGPPRLPGYKYLDGRNPAEDNEKEQVQELIKFIYDNRPSF